MCVTKFVATFKDSTGHFESLEDALSQLPFDARCFTFEDEKEYAENTVKLDSDTFDYKIYEIKITERV